MKSSFRKKSTIILRLMTLFFCFKMIGCEEENKKLCDQLEIIDGHFEVRTDPGGPVLKLPALSIIEQGSPNFGECNIARGFSISYEWYGGELKPSNLAAGVNKTVFHPVRIYYRGEMTADLWKDEGSRYEGAVKHLKYPLEFYPKFFSHGDSESKSENIRQDGVWGVVGTKYKNPINGRKFEAFCGLGSGNLENESLLEVSEFGSGGDEKCRGWILIEHERKVYVLMVDVWANWGYPKHEAIKEMNFIYDSIVEEFLSYLENK